MMGHPDEAPVVDEADFVSAFMSLSGGLQSAALMTLFAARDLPGDLVQPTKVWLDQLEELPEVPAEVSHLLAMTRNLVDSWYIARMTFRTSTHQGRNHDHHDH